MRPVLCAVFLVSLFVLSPVTTSAHASLVSATPAAGSSVEATIGRLEATFSQNLDPSRTSLEVRDGSGTAVARGGARGDGPRQFRLTLPVLAPGSYEVRWVSYSAEDGELARGSYAFAVLVPTQPPTEAPTPPPSPSASPTMAPSTPAATSSPPLATLLNPNASPVPTSTGEATSGDAVLLLPIGLAALLVGLMAVRLLRRRAR